MINMSKCRNCKHLIITEYWRRTPMYTCGITDGDIVDVDKDFARPRNCTYFRRKKNDIQN